MRPRTDDGFDANPIHAVLDAAEIPWRLTRAELAERYGTRPHPAYHWEVIEIPTPRPVCAGLLWPISVQVFERFSPARAGHRVHGRHLVRRRWRENLQRTMEQFLAPLGQSPASGSSDTIERSWRCNAAALTLTVWPPDLQRFAMTNPSHEREPRLVTGCHLRVVTAASAYRRRRAGFSPARARSSRMAARPAWRCRPDPAQSDAAPGALITLARAPMTASSE